MIVCKQGDPAGPRVHFVGSLQSQPAPLQRGDDDKDGMRFNEGLEFGSEEFLKQVTLTVRNETESPAEEKILRSLLPYAPAMLRIHGLKRRGECFEVSML